jgi:signal transduction histidine kinase
VAYRGEVDRVEDEIRASNRHIALLAGRYLETLLRQIGDEIVLYEGVEAAGLPPRLPGMAWERVGDDGRVLGSQLAAHRVGRGCGYGELLTAPPGASMISEIGSWIEGAPPTVLVLGRSTASGRLVAVLDPASLHQELQGWTPGGGDRHLYVVGGSGSLLFYSDLKPSLGSADLRSNPPIRHIVEGREGDLRYTSTVSGKQRLGTVQRVNGADWAVVVSADVGESLIGIQSRARWLLWSIVFAVAAAVAILAVTSRQLVRPVLEIARALRQPGRDPKAPLDIAPSLRRVREHDELVIAFDELSAEVAAVERELVQAEKASLLGQLASGLAHEMGTPLNVITGNAEYLLRKVGADDPARQPLELIVRQGQRIAAMIRRLLDVSRPAEARLVAVELEPLVRQCLEIVPGLHPGIELRCDLDPDLPRVLADPKLLEHALMNLVLNACQAMPNGGRLAVVGGVVEGESRLPVALAVSDTGCGIASEHLARIFEPFFSTKAQGEGTGLGLAIVDRILRQHGAAIEVTSTPGRGTVMLLRLRAVAGAGPTGRPEAGAGR